MTDFLKGQMDYIFFCYGLAFIILAGVCVSLRKAEREKFPWHHLGLFGLTHGISEWLDLIALSFGDSGLFQSIRVLVMTLSFVFLMEFGRAGHDRLRSAAPGRWIIVVPLALAAGGYWLAGWNGLDAASRYFLGFFGGLLGAAALLRYAGMDRQGLPERKVHGRVPLLAPLPLIFLMIFILAAGWITTLYTDHFAHEVMMRDANQRIVALRDHLGDQLKESERAVHTLAGSPWIPPALLWRATPSRSAGPTSSSISIGAPWMSPSATSSNWKRFSTGSPGTTG